MALRCGWRHLALVLVLFLIIQFVFYFKPEAIESVRNVPAKFNYGGLNKKPTPAVAEDTGDVAADPHHPSRFVAKTTRENAAFVILCRNTDLDSIKESLTELEEKFNNRYHYPYVFLNEKPFTDEFKNSISEVVSGTTHFGIIPTEHWSYPPWIDQDRARQEREKMAKNHVIYGGSEPYRHMCRFNSGFFFRHPLLAQYDWYWRVEPSVKFPCIIDKDPFKVLRENNKLYGFTISIKEYPKTIPTLWNTTLKFMDEFPNHVSNPNMLKFIQKAGTNGTPEYNGCHYWSNFEVGSLNFFRSDEYLAYFDYLDRAGGFFYERWGDAPVHSIALSIFLDKSKIHWFEDLGYFHGPLWNCPKGEAHKRLQCTCEEKKSIETENPNWSCIKEFIRTPN
ncbi:hypothetical protein EV182_002951 [Spiromyces aspiralis]|uniref:Uncharacterized protein n=1 Tax=Spiromyces aspiralis TaxID=68401 RepID=A0ACC1HFT7_9FUNG|nr:hypothetical protein EV182_002951 [Spiromyces aspiralis]